MGIYRQGEGNRGSLKWIQILINRQPEILNLKIRQSFRIPRSIEIKWVSPLKEKGYAEYRDEAFLEVLGIATQKVKLSDFWPKGGPQWDALGKLRRSGT